eukprot:c6535_g1_i1.p1 GENE.c6535_g1_i1~~c6535_g1_i1.p1  ORF type:complete len:129 (+),score=7.29 c6535_g1_i1:350-736(+)
MKNYCAYFLFLIILFIAIEEKGYGQQSVKINKISKSKVIADSLYALGSKYDEIGNSKKALALYENSLNIYQSIKENQKIGDCFNSIGTIYYFRGDYFKTLFFFKAISSAASATISGSLVPILLFVDSV